MDNIVESYLLFKSKTIAEIVTILVNNNYPDFNINGDLSKVVYDFLNETCLSSDYLSKSALKSITGVSLDQNSNTILSIIIEYGFVSRSELKSDISLLEIYKFIIDAIIYYICVCGRLNSRITKYVNIKNIKKETIMNLFLNTSQVFKKAVNKDNPEIDSILEDNLNKTDSFNNSIFDDTYNISYKYIGDNLYIGNVYYHDKELDLYDESEIEHVKKEYESDIFMNGVELLSLDIIERNLAGDIMKVLYKIPDNILDEKNSINRFLNITNVSCVISNIIPVINSSYINSHVGIVNNFRDLLFEVGIDKDSLVDNIYDTDYLLIDYIGDNDEFKKLIKYKTNIIIKNDIPARDSLYLLKCGVKYFIKKK